MFNTSTILSNPSANQCNLRSNQIIPIVRTLNLLHAPPSLIQALSYPVQGPTNLICMPTKLVQLSEGCARFFVKNRAQICGLRCASSDRFCASECILHPICIGTNYESRARKCCRNVLTTEATDESQAESHLSGKVKKMAPLW